MIAREEIANVLKGYNKKEIRIATICSHTALQIFHGARQEGIKTIGICLKDHKKIYDAFPYGRPDEYILVDSYSELPEDELIKKNAIAIPHGSFVEYYGKKNIESTRLPMFGNRMSLTWEGSRDKLYEWMKDSGLKVPKVFTPETIDRPCIVKTSGAKGGHGYMIVSSPEEFKKKIKTTDYHIQEYISGVRVYPHFFFSPLSKTGYTMKRGSLEMMSIDRRIESTIHESYRSTIAGIELKPSFTVMGNEGLVIRESLIKKVLEAGEGVIESSYRLFGGLTGPFCVEMICTDELEFYTFEISARIVAGTNLYPTGSPYTSYSYNEPTSTGRRIAIEIKNAAKADRLGEVIY